MAGCRSDQAIEQVGVLDLIASAERFDDALDVGPIFLTRMNMVRYLIALRPPRRIGERQGILLITSRKDQEVLAPQIDRYPANPRNPASLMSPKAQ